MAKEDTRQHIVNTASELFYSQGYNLTGINEIIEKSGIAKATLYSHFKSKDDLCIAYLDERDGALLIQLREFCSKRKKGNQQLLGILEFLIPFFESELFNGCWCLRTLAEVPRDSTKIRNKIKANKQDFLDEVQSLVKSNLPKLSKAKQEKLGRSIYLLYEGALTESHLQNEIWPIHQSIVVLKTLLK